MAPDNKKDNHESTRIGTKKTIFVFVRVISWLLPICFLFLDLGPLGYLDLLVARYIVF